MTAPTRVLAVDLGATSVRVAGVDLGAGFPEVKVHHRWQHAPVLHADGSLRWDWQRIRSEVVRGLEKGLGEGPVASVGVDAWGVDYGLIDRAGKLIADPYSYRDSRTEGWQAHAHAIGMDRLYQSTGIQLMAINTIFQLACHDPDELDAAERILLLPDLLIHQLVKFDGAERSNASTTGLLSAHSQEWDTQIIAEMGLDQSLFPEVRQAGTRAGTWRGAPIHLVGSHDTSSAFLGMPGAGPGTVLVSTGTWVIVGIERDRPDTSAAARDANFSNEAGAFGGYRFVKNVVGFWILDRCREAWGDPPIEQLFHEAEMVDEDVTAFDASDARFLTSPDMVGEVRAAAGIPPGGPRGLIVRSVLESIVEGVAQVIDQIEKIVSIQLSRISVVGGGARVPLLVDLLANRTGLEVVTGSTEATALGNAMAQGVAIGRFKDAREARDWLDAGTRSMRVA